MDVHVDQVLELLQLDKPLLGVVGEGQALQLALGVEAEQDCVKDVDVDQGARLIRVVDLVQGPDEVGDVLEGLQVVRLLRICEGLRLQSLGVVT